MINITARRFDLKPGAKAGVEKELKRVEKMLPETSSFDVTFTSINGMYECDITVKDAGSFIRGEGLSPHVESSIDFAVDDLKRKIRKLKTNFRHKNRKGGIDAIANAVMEMGMDHTPSEQETSTEVKRHKDIVLQMMTEDEAMVQMEMLGHTFFVYLGEDGLVNVIYSREKGYGILHCAQ